MKKTQFKLLPSQYCKSLIIKLYPNQNQISQLNQNVGNSRFIYNYFLTLNTNQYLLNETFISIKDALPKLKDIKKEYTFLNNTHIHTLQFEIKNITKCIFTHKKLKRGFPKYKKKKEYSGSFYISNQSFKVIDNHHIHIQKIGDIYFRSGKLPINKSFIRGTIYKDGIDWYCSLTYVMNKDIKNVDIFKAIGIDLGIKDFVITSNNEVYSNKKYGKKYKKQIKLANRKLARSKKGSNNRKKKLLRLHRLHSKIARRRQSYIHMVSTDLITKNQAICIEDLNISGMKRNHKLAFSISDVSLSAFVNTLKYKAEWYGKEIIQISRWYPSSQTCSFCGHRQKMPLNKRTYICKDCGHIIDRDYNAAINIKRKGIKSMTNVGELIPEQIQDRKNIDLLSIERLWRKHMEDGIKFGFHWKAYR